MNIAFNLGFVFFSVSLAIRYFWTQHLGVDFFALGSLQEWEKWIYGISILWFMLAFWNVAIRLRCPACRSENVAHTGSKEVDRWVGPKKVTESLGNGKSTTRSVTTTFVKMEHAYLCGLCDNRWVQHEKREKT